MIKPNYDFEIIYEDNHTNELYFWLLDVEGEKDLLWKLKTHI